MKSSKLFDAESRSHLRVSALNNRFDEIEESYNDGSSNYDMYKEQLGIPEMIRDERKDLDRERFRIKMDNVEKPFKVFAKGLQFKKSQVSVFGIIAFLIVFFILFVYVFAPFANVASDVSIDNVRGTGMVAFVVNYWSFLLFIGFVIAFAWKLYAG